ncbi:Rho termination factor N-terminal domain-containing protein [Streptomyces aculeolatus]|uniref:Rho termination factor N-terminal domain-containing protein n=1 Tax=Streptomyces aculeolatus TaxID=270689 RepID=UPI001CEC682D|nr:Rho termination factor N-terminal domain-containing protein [Streptomyces aculeolatus]
MPKITRHGGPTIAGATVVGGTWTDGDEPDAWPEPEEPAPAAGTGPPAAPERPAEAAPKTAWLEYAESLGVEGAAEMTKKQLIDATAQGAE